METKSVAVRVVSELFERAENQANTIDSQRKNIIKLNKQLEDKYSTETHILMTRNAVVALADKFDELSDEFSNLNGLLEDINSYAGNISDDSEYNDARSYQRYARDYAEELRILLNKETEEVA
jgi:polyhydroxyalkanoate synthesis regulator phasin